MKNSKFKLFTLKALYKENLWNYLLHFFINHTF